MRAFSRILIISAALLIVHPSESSKDINPDLTSCSTILDVDFEQHRNGIYSEDMAIVDFGSSGARRGFGAQRGHIVKHGNGSPQNSNYLRTLQPGGCSSGASCGLRIPKLLNTTSSSITYSYDFRIGEGARFGSGGLLPGVCTGDNCHTVCSSDGDWAARAKWLPAGELASFVNQFHFETSCGDLYPLSTPDGDVILQAGKWYNLVQHVKLNTRGSKNGMITSYVDGKLAYWSSRLQYSATPSKGIEWFILQGFFTGTNDNTNTAFVDFDNIWVGECQANFIPPTSVECPSKQDVEKLQECWAIDHSVATLRPDCFKEICPDASSGKLPPFNSCTLSVRTAWEDASAASGYETEGPACDMLLGAERCESATRDVIFAYCSDPYEVLHGWKEDRGAEQPTDEPTVPNQPEQTGGMGTEVLVVIILVSLTLVMGGVIFGVRKYRDRQNHGNINQLVVRMPQISRNPLFIDDGIPVPTLDAGTNQRQVTPLYRKPVHENSGHNGQKGGAFFGGRPKLSTKQSHYSEYSDYSTGSRVKLHPPSYDSRSRFSSFSRTPSDIDMESCDPQDGVPFLSMRPPSIYPPEVPARRNGNSPTSSAPSLPRYTASNRPDSFESDW